MKKDSWEILRQYTSARIALGRCGASVPTEELLKFRLAHAHARDAVLEPFDAEKMVAELKQVGLSALAVSSQAENMTQFLKRPDLGRVLKISDVQKVTAISKGGFDVTLQISPGLSALAVKEHAVNLVTQLSKLCAARNLKVSPVIVVNFGRVAIQDQLGELLKAKLAVMIIGERPGLGSADSAGAYVVFHPKKGNTDADRNCVSNIHAKGLAVELAATKIFYLIESALKRQLSGVNLKEESNLNLKFFPS